MELEPSVCYHSVEVKPLYEHGGTMNSAGGRDKLINGSTRVT